MKVYVETQYLREENIQEIRSVCEACGYEFGLFHSPQDPGCDLSDCEVLYCTRPFSLQQVPRLRWCHSASAGVGGFVISGVFDSGDVILTNSSGAYGRAISEHVIMVTLMMLRKMPEYRKIVDAHQWKRDLPIRTIADSRIAIVGTGDIGRSTAGLFRSLGAKSVIGFNRRGRAVEQFDQIYTMSGFTQHVSDIDILVMCVPGTPATDGLLSAERIAALPETAYVINVGRGSSIDQDALIRALNDGKIAGAALDVVVPEPLPPDHPLWTTRNCLLTTHTSGDMGLPYTIDRTVEFFCENLRRFAAGEELIKVIDPKTGY